MLTQSAKITYVGIFIVILTISLTSCENIDGFDDAHSPQGAAGIDDSHRCATVNENGTATLACPDGQTIDDIDFASYGTPDGSCDKGFTESACHAKSSLSIVEEACLDKRSCSVKASNAVFGDPCRGTYKRLSVNYRCSGASAGGSGLKATYFDNVDFTGKTVERVDRSVDFDWGRGSPASGIGADSFSARWTGFVRAGRSETYTFYTVGDDGIRLFVNGKLVVNDWSNHGARERTGTIALEAGRFYPIKLEYYESSGGAVAKLLWSSKSVSKQTIPETSLFTQEGEEDEGEEDEEEDTEQDDADLCPNDPNKTEPGNCGCGVPEGKCAPTTPQTPSKVGKIVYPWRSTTAIVKTGTAFQVWFNQGSGQTVVSATLKSANLTLFNLPMSKVSGSWVYDKLSGNRYNTLIAVTVPTTVPDDRYDLVLETTTGTVTSPGAVKVVKSFKSQYYIVHMSDGHLNQSGYDSDVLWKRKSAMIDIANIIDAEIIIETGDNMYNVINHPEREEYYFVGNPALGTKGMSKASAATFLVPGDHDGLRGNDYTKGTVQENSDFFNDYWGLQTSTFEYGNGRFVMLNNGWDCSKTGAGVHQGQVDDARAWLRGAGSDGNFVLTAGHAYDKLHSFINDTRKVNLVLAGDKHHVRTQNPFQFEPGSASNAYIAGSIRDHFEFNLFKVNNTTGTFTTPSGKTSVANVLNSGNQGSPSTWVLNLTLSYAKANSGANAANTATIVNKYSFPIENAKVRFVMPTKGKVYKTSAGTIIQQFDGNTHRIVDVKVNVGANSTVKVTVQ